MISRRSFLGQLSAASAGTLGHTAPAQSLREVLAALFEKSDPLHVDPGTWDMFGRIAMRRLADSVLIQDGFTVHGKPQTNCSFSFQARAPEGTEQVQIWAGIRCRDRDSRYVFALRGGDNDDLYLARYAPDGEARFLGFAPLDFHPVPGTWYKLRAVAIGDRVQIYVNEETVPRIDVRDEAPLWSEGGVSLGGGWLPAEFRSVSIEPLTASDVATIERAGLWQPALADKQQRRVAQCGAYRPLVLNSIDQVRTEFPLDGNWLFTPEQVLPHGATPEAEVYDDSGWHVIDVPNFWTPCLTWLHGETGFPALEGISSTKGLSDRLWEAELARLDSYTFDWRQVSSAWYRQYIDLPTDLAGRRFELCFDAIAKVSAVSVNGVKVGAHVGMFGEVRCEITAAVHPGRNVVAVHVFGKLKSETPNKTVGVAVTVDVTSSMLQSLPHGMYPIEAGGIWQPVKLLVTQQTWIEDVYVKPRLDGADFEVTVGTPAAQPCNISVAYSIRASHGRETLYEAPAVEFKRASREQVLHLSTPKLAPRLWSPGDPVLYSLEVTLWSESGLLDRRSIAFGFRTFSAQDGRLYLNGQPFWLRGADHFPHALRPNDSVLARRFMQLARDGNVVATRSHTAPFSETWLQAADEIGMAVSFEGTWPWLMLEGEPPSEELLQEWSNEFLALIHKFRSHPSIVLWTVNNEMKFEMFDKARPDLLKRKWKILSDTVKSIRAADPTRPIVCDSSYCRKQIGADYENLVRPNGFDDGDIDDAHCYPGWYEPSFFHYFRGEFGSRFSSPGRPLISQEMSTGYPRNDDGHACRFYLFKHYTPQSLVGDEAYENRDPAIFLKRQALITKELAEAIRRTNRQQCSGIMHFAYLSWFKNVWNPESIVPFESYNALKLALQPVLVSAELYGRHFYAGSRQSLRVSIANDAANMRSLLRGKLQWRIAARDEELANGAIEVDSVPYYSNQWTNLSISLPAIALPRRVDARLELTFIAEKVLVSENQYDLVVASRSWAWHADWSRAAHVSADGDVPAILKQQGVRSVRSMLDLKLDDVAILSNAGKSLDNPSMAEALRRYVAQGGNALLFNGGATLARIFPEQIIRYQPGTGEIAFMRVPESPVFDGLEPLDLAWWGLGSDQLPHVCEGCHQLVSGASGLSALAEGIHTHGYLQQPSDYLRIAGSPLFELRIGAGRLIVCELMLLEAAPFDPIAGRLLNNLIAGLNARQASCGCS
jgi:hypothetical protein